MFCKHSSVIFSSQCVACPNLFRSLIMDQTFSHAPLHSCRFLTFDQSDRLHAYVDKLPIRLGSNLVGKVIMVTPWPNILLVDLQWIPTETWPLVRWAVSVHLQTNCWSDWAQIWCAYWVIMVLHCHDYLLVTFRWIPNYFLPLIGWVSVHFQTKLWSDWAQNWCADSLCVIPGLSGLLHWILTVSGLGSVDQFPHIWDMLIARFIRSSVNNVLVHVGLVSHWNIDMGYFYIEFPQSYLKSHPKEFYSWMIPPTEPNICKAIVFKALISRFHTNNANGFHLTRRATLSSFSFFSLFFPELLKIGQKGSLILHTS